MNSSGLREQVKPVNVIRNYIYKCTDPVPKKVRTDNEAKVKPQPDTKGIRGIEQARRSTPRRPSRLFSKKTTDRLFEGEQSIDDCMFVRSSMPNATAGKR